MGAGGGGGGRSTKKIFAQGKIEWKRNSCTPINHKKYSCYGLKKIHTRNLMTKKNSCGSKIPLPPITFLIPWRRWWLWLFTSDSSGHKLHPNANNIRHTHTQSQDSGFNLCKWHWKAIFTILAIKTSLKIGRVLILWNSSHLITTS